MTIVFAILIFSLMVFVHELGHFVAAKLSGVQVNEFSIFMGPAIVKWNRGETLYAIRCIPFGGYCAMEGENEETDNPRSFQKASWWKRLIILLAGSFMNFVTGFLIYLALYIPMEQVVVPQIVEFTDCCIFQGEDGIQVDDRILEIDGEKVFVTGDVSLILGLNDTGIHDIKVQRGNEILVFEDFPMTHSHTDVDEPYTHYGFTYGKVVPIAGWEKVEYVWAMTCDTVRNVRLSLQMLVTGKAALSEVSGPVGIVSQMNEIAQESETTTLAMLNLLSIGAFLAINLAVMNLLPIPALDGGRAVCLLLTTVTEKITGKKINPKIEMYIHGIGMILLLALMALIMFKDVFFLFKR